ncbi:hypothetical protein HON52_02840 [Candidatus Uhrbacteria bacterium]|jgi:hypothetical protein|nr:hypothetical protein [Candidatus Uhrbacteria bacterium]
MENTFIVRKRLFAAVTTVAMILGSLSAAIVPQTASAASGGDLIVGESLSTLYYYGYDGARYTFPNEKTFMTWRADFDDVETISDSELADISLAGNVVYRPGSHWIKITSDAKTYAVSTDGMIHWIETEDVAVDYAGDDWSDMIHDVPDVFFVDYSAGASLETATAFDGAAYMSGDDTYLSWGGEMRMMTDDGMDANYYWDWMLLDGEGIDDSGLSAGDDIDSAECALFDIAQTGDCTEEEDDSDSAGDLEVSVSSDTAASASVPNSAARVAVASYDLEAGDDDAELNSLTVTLGGLATTTAIGSDGVYLYEGESRLTEGRTVNSSTREATFTSLDFVVEAGETRTITVVVDMSTTINSGDFYLYIADEDDVDADGDVDGDFPLEGESMSITDIDVGSVTITKTGSIGDPTLGEDDAIIGKFQVQTGSGEDISLETITLKIDQSSDHDDFKIWQGSDQVGTGEYIGNKLVLFTLDEEYEIEKSKNVNFSVSADIGGQADDDVKVYLDSDADLKATGDDYGFNVTVTRTAYDGDSCTTSSGDCSFSDVQGGDVTFIFDGPSADNVKDGAEDYTFLAFSVTSANWAEVDSMAVIVDGTDADAGGDSGLDDLILTDIKLVMADDASLVAGPQELSASGSATQQTITFTDNWVLEEGETYDMAVTADVDSSVAEDNDTIAMTLDVSGLTIEDSNNDSIAAADIVPSADMAGYTHTVASASLTVTAASTPTGDTTVVRGSNDVDVVGFNFEAGDGSDIEITDLTVTVNVDEDSGGTFAAGEEGSTASTDRISSCSLYEAIDDTFIAGPESVSSATTGDILFQNFSWTVEAGAIEKVFVRCNLANVAPGTDDEFGFEINAAADVTALDDEGTSLSSSDITASAINGAETVKISITANGSLTVAVDSGTPSADFIATGSSDNHVATFEWTATNEDFEITTFTVAEQQAKQDDADDDDSAADEDASYANNISLVTIEYPAEDGSTMTATTSMSSNEAKFSLSSGSGIWIENGEDADTLVYVDVPGTDRSSGGSATSNEKIMLDTFVDTSNDDNFKTVGQGSGVTLDDDDLTLTSTDPNTFVIRETVPTVTLDSSSPSGASVPSDLEVFRFTVAASSNEDVVLNELIWKISSTDNGTSNWNQCDTDNSGANARTASSTDVDTTDFDFYNLSKEGTSTAVDVNTDWLILKATGAVCDATAADVGFVHLTLATAEVVPAGSSYTYALYMDTTPASATNDDSIQLELAADPIVSTYLAASDSNEADLTAIDTALTVTSSSGYTAGDIVCLDLTDDGCDSTDEKALVTVASGNVLTLVRGYLGTEPDASNAFDASDDVDRLPSSFFWEDDGNTSTSTTAEEWGSYLVDNLPLTGNALSF